MAEMKFGYFPEPLDFTIGDLSVATLPGLDAQRADVTQSEGVEDDWCFAPLAKVHDIMTGDVRTRPASGRVFGLPKTHTLSHRASDDVEHLRFIVWMLGFIYGIRLTESEAGFLDATPIKPGKLHDVVWLGNSEPKALGIVDAYWHKHAANPRIAKGLMGIVHSLFLSETPTLLDFERFIYLYTAFDGCHAVWCAMTRANPLAGGHSKRIANLCSAFKRSIPDWADPTPNTVSGVRSGKVFGVRNDTLHDGLFFDEPWGFQIYGGIASSGDPNRNILLEMRCLVCRLVFGIVGFNDPDYILSPIDTRQQHGAKL